MLKTWAFFTFGGLFTASYSHAVRRLPLLKSRRLHHIAIAPAIDITTVHHFHTSIVFLGPALYFACTGTAFFLGYLAHRYEENVDEKYRRILERNPDAPLKIRMSIEEAIRKGGK